MAPFRNRDRSNRSGRGQVEHNVLEGLPINQYKEVLINIGPNSTENKQVELGYFPEHPMPKDSNQLQEHSQQLLRAARAGRIYKPPAPVEEEGEKSDEEHEHKVEPQGFTVKKWVKIARHLEEPEPEYLAKRRKGLPSQYAVSTVTAQPTPLRETKVKKVDADGNVTVLKALVPEGQAIPGEVQATDDIAVVEAAPAIAAPGTVVEGVGVVNAEGVVIANTVAEQTPPRRRPPPPKKKTKKAGPGRGKKKVLFVEGTEQQGTPASGSESLNVPGDAKPEGGSVEPSDGDTPMPDAGEEEEEGDDESDEEDGEDREQSPTPGNSATPSKAPETSATELVAAPVDVPVQEVRPDLDPISTIEPPAPIAMADSASESVPVANGESQNTSGGKVRTSRDPSSSPELPLSAMSHSRQNSMNQMPTLPIEPPNVPDVQSEPIAIVEPEIIPQPAEEVIPAVTESTAQLAPDVPPEVTIEDPARAPTPKEVISELPTHEPETVPTILAPQPALEPLPDPNPAPVAESELLPEPPTEPEEPEPTPAIAPPAEEDEPDLLGSLEAHLDKEDK